MEFRLKRAGISCVVFRGGMTMQAREDALAAFNEDPTLKAIGARLHRVSMGFEVILISLKAGGEGLNLQAGCFGMASDLSFRWRTMSSYWTPGGIQPARCRRSGADRARKLREAIQRAHRIGQTRPVKAVRFITAETIEEKIIKLQEKKQLVFDASIDGSNASLGKLTEQDLRFLFQH